MERPDAICVITTCNKPIKARFRICAECEEIYGRRREDWPGWLRFLAQDKDREWNQYRLAQQMGIEFIPLDDIE